jgi:hypothetical protein
MKLVRALALLALAPLLGCITMSGDQLKDRSPERRGTSPAIEQTVGDFSFHLDGGKMVTSNKMGRGLNDEILRRWQEDGFIASHTYVKSSQFTDASEFQLTLSGHQEGESSIFLQILSGLTLTVIPYYVDSKMELRYSLKNAETGCVFEASAADSFDTVVGLLLLPATPFAQRGRIRTFDRLADELYFQLASQGAFDSGAPCLSTTGAAHPVE